MVVFTISLPPYANFLRVGTLCNDESTGLDLLSNLRITVFKFCEHQTFLHLLPYNSKKYYLGSSSSSTVHVNDWLVFCVVPLPLITVHICTLFLGNINHSQSFRQHIQPNDLQKCLSPKLQENICNNLLHIFKRIFHRHFILTCPK